MYFQDVCVIFTSEQDNVILSMNTVTEKMPCRVLETAPQPVETGQDIKELVAMLAGNCRRHVETDVGTRLNTENACRKNGLYPAVHFQGAERSEEYVAGNPMQD